LLYKRYKNCLLEGSYKNEKVTVVDIIYVANGVWHDA
jgi:hypothetical protein